MGFAQMLAKSLDLIKMVRPLQGTIAGTCRSLHVLLPPAPDVDVSCSVPSLPCSIFVSCPPATEKVRVERLAENLVHERCTCNSPWWRRSSRWSARFPARS